MQNKVKHAYKKNDSKASEKNAENLPQFNKKQYNTKLGAEKYSLLTQTIAVYIMI